MANTPKARKITDSRSPESFSSLFGTADQEDNDDVDVIQSNNAIGCMKLDGGGMLRMSPPGFGPDFESSETRFDE